MQRWQLSIGLAGTALVAALIAPRLFPFLGGAPDVEPVPVAVTEDPVIETPPIAEEPRSIDIVIALDTSGSMNRLIDSTRARLWDIVNEVDAQDPNANLRVGLVAYGSPQYGSDTGYTRVVMPLTDDLDALYTSAWSLKTDGGEEYVGAVIERSLESLEWAPRDNPENRRLLFIAGNETAALGPVSHVMAARNAVSHGVKVSTLFAGSEQSGRQLQWDTVAQFGEGRFMAIDAKQSAVAVNTPYDQQLEQLNSALNSTYVAGNVQGQAKQAEMLDNDNNSAGYGIGALASRIATKSTSKYKANWDLVGQADSGKLDTASIDRNALPGDLKDLADDDLKAELGKRGKKRRKAKKEIQQIQSQRSQWIQEKNAQGEGQGMDEAMTEVLTDLL